jgi:hypothetical protein
VISLRVHFSYVQPPVASIVPEIGVSPDIVAPVISAMQIGYGIGPLCSNRSEVSARIVSDWMANLFSNGALSIWTATHMPHGMNAITPLKRGDGRFDRCSFSLRTRAPMLTFYVSVNSSHPRRSPWVYSTNIPLKV